MGIEIKENGGRDDRYSQLNQETETDLPQKGVDEEKKETEINPPSQPAEEHLITKVDGLRNNDFQQDESSYEDPDQGPEEIDPVSRPRKFQNVSPENHNKQLNKGSY